MKTQDLRIGSYLFKQGEVVKIVEIGIKHKGDTNYYLRSENDNCGYWIDQFEPIPLTEKILLKCGFNKNELGGYIMYTELGSMLCIYKDGSFRSNERYIDTKIKYLHQLQNLIYALTGTELNIVL